MDADILRQDDPMTYAYYHKVIKGKSPKAAPTYIPEESQDTPRKESEPVYVCGVCGSEYHGDIPVEDLPDDYVCPVCKQPKSVFVKK